MTTQALEDGKTMWLFNMWYLLPGAISLAVTASKPAFRPSVGAVLQGGLEGFLFKGGVNGCLRVYFIVV